MAATWGPVAATTLSWVARPRLTVHFYGGRRCCEASSVFGKITLLFRSCSAECLSARPASIHEWTRRGTTHFTSWKSPSNKFQRDLRLRRGWSIAYFAICWWTSPEILIERNSALISFIHPILRADALGWSSSAPSRCGHTRE